MTAAGRDGARAGLLMAALRHIPFDGWTDTAFSRAASDLGWPLEEAARLFPGGAAEAAVLFGELADEAMAEALSNQDLSDMRIRDRVALAVRCRLEYLEPHREAVRRLVPFMLLPGNAGRGMRALYRTVDAIWHALGDRSADFSFYTKRALLAGVLSSTTLFWLDDGSEGSAESWAFLDRRIGDVMSIQRIRGKTEKIRGRLPDPFRLLRRIRPVSS